MWFITHMIFYDCFILCLKMAATGVKHSAKKGARNGMGPDGLPRLPPIERPDKREDRFANSKLLTFRMSKYKQEMLKKIM